MVSTRWEYLGAGRLAGLTLYLGCAEWRETDSEDEEFIEKKKKSEPEFSAGHFFRDSYLPDWHHT